MGMPASSSRPSIRGTATMSRPEAAEVHPKEWQEHRPAAGAIGFGQEDAPGPPPDRRSEERTAITLGVQFTLPDVNVMRQGRGAHVDLRWVCRRSDHAQHRHDERPHQAPFVSSRHPSGPVLPRGKYQPRRCRAFRRRRGPASCRCPRLPPPVSGVRRRADCCCAPAAAGCSDDRRAAGAAGAADDCRDGQPQRWSFERSACRDGTGTGVGTGT